MTSGIELVRPPDLADTATFVTLFSARLEPAGRIAYDARFEILSQSTLKAIVAFRTESGLDWQRVTRGYRILVLDPGEDVGAIRLFRRSGAKVIATFPACWGGRRRACRRAL